MEQAGFCKVKPADEFESGLTFEGGNFLQESLLMLWGGVVHNLDSHLTNAIQDAQIDLHSPQTGCFECRHWLKLERCCGSIGHALGPASCTYLGHSEKCISSQSVIQLHNTNTWKMYVDPQQHACWT